MHLRSRKKISNLFTFLFLWGDLWVEDLKVQFMKTLIPKVFFTSKKISPPKVQEKSQTSSPFFFLVGFVGWRTQIFKTLVTRVSFCPTLKKKET